HIFSYIKLLLQDSQDFYLSISHKFLKHKKKPRLSQKSAWLLIYLFIYFELWLKSYLVRFSESK
ncbi:hypothetical protein, partial [Priestia megaterium]|uniref:hypothetical protein n=1 Tax=Priestia megaterium TaxID=1404 RepID=UPI003AAD2831